MNIRFVTIEDAKKIVEIYNYFVSKTTVTFDYYPLSIKEMENKINTITKSYPFLVVEEDNQIIGYAYGSRFREKTAYDWAVETTVYLDHEKCKKGYGTHIYRQLLEDLKIQGYVVIYACVTIPNIASDIMHQKLGFEKIGIFKASGYKFEKWQDICWYQKILHEDVTVIQDIEIIKKKYNKKEL